MAKKWTEEKNAWLFKHGSEGHEELYKLFCEAFPDAETTVTALANQRSRIGACTKHNLSTASRKSRPLYSEQIKKGYVRIKVAQPSVWMMKSKWVWLETHPWLYNTVTDNDVFIFLDGDNRNFSPDNIEKVSRAELRVLNNKFYGVVKGDPEMTLFNVAKARLTIAMLDAGEKIGQVIVHPKNSTRLLKSKAVENTKKFYNRHKDEPEFKARLKRYRENRSEESKQREKEYKREWRKNKMKEGNNDFDGRI